MSSGGPGPARASSRPASQPDGQTAGEEIALIDLRTAPAPGLLGSALFFALLSGRSSSLSSGWRLRRVRRLCRRSRGGKGLDDLLHEARLWHCAQHLDLVVNHSLGNSLDTVALRQIDEF